MVGVDVEAGARDTLLNTTSEVVGVVVVVGAGVVSSCTVAVVETATGVEVDAVVPTAASATAAEEPVSKLLEAAAEAPLLTSTLSTTT